MTNDQGIAAIPLFASLRDAERRAVDAHIHWHTYDAHQQIIDRDTSSRDVFFIVRGNVRVMYYSRTGREVSLEDIGEGGFFGELAAIDGQPRSAIVMAVQKSVVASLPAEVFIRTVTENPKVALGLMTRLASMVRHSTERIFDLSTLRAQSRVCNELVRLATANKKDDNTSVIRPIPVHSDIASRISTTRETVARVLSELARHKVLRRDRASLAILDYARLRELAEEYEDE